MAREYYVFTDLSPDELTDVAMEIYKKWIAFSLGLDDVAGYKVMNPTGRMASSIRVEGRSINHIAIVADAPEAEILEEGHEAIDLKQKLIAGRAYPMHRGTGVPVFNPTFAGRAANVWAAPKAEGFNGVARIPTEITPENAGSWIIPAMAAWSPARHLADMARNGEFS